MPTIDCRRVQLQLVAGRARGFLAFLAWFIGIRQLAISERAGRPSLSSVHQPPARAKDDFFRYMGYYFRMPAAHSVSRRKNCAIAANKRRRTDDII